MTTTGTRSPLGAHLAGVSRRHERADTISPDVGGLLVGAPPASVSGAWPLVDALRRPYSNNEPLTWLAEAPSTEVQTIEKQPLNGTTVKVAVSLGTPTTIGAWTDVSLQVAAHPGGAAMQAVTNVLDAAVMGDADQWLALTLSSLGSPLTGPGSGLQALQRWPGVRLVVVAPSAVGAISSGAMAYAEASNGALRIIADPYITENLVIALAGVAVGVTGPTRLMADEAAHLGVHVASMVTLAVEAAPGAIVSVSAVERIMDWNVDAWDDQTKSHWGK